MIYLTYTHRFYAFGMIFLTYTHRFYAFGMIFLICTHSFYAFGMIFLTFTHRFYAFDMIFLTLRQGRWRWSRRYAASWARDRMWRRALDVSTHACNSRGDTQLFPRSRVIILLSNDYCCPFRSLRVWCPFLRPVSSPETGSCLNYLYEM